MCMWRGREFCVVTENSFPSFGCDVVNLAAQQNFDDARWVIYTHKKEKKNKQEKRHKDTEKRYNYGW